MWFVYFGINLRILNSGVKAPSPISARCGFLGTYLVTKYPLNCRVQE